MRLFKVFLPYFRKSFIYRGDLGIGNNLGKLVLTTHKKSYRLGIIVEEWELEEKGSGKFEKILGTLEDYRYPPYLFPLRDYMQRNYFLSEDDFYGDFLKLDRVTEHLSLEVLLLLEDPNPYFDNLLEKLKIRKSYPVTLSEERLKRGFGARWNYYKAALLKRGAKLSFKLSERPGYYREFKKIVNFFQKESKTSEGDLLALDTEPEFWAFNYRNFRRGISLIRILSQYYQIAILLPERVITSSLLEFLSFLKEVNYFLELSIVSRPL